jgi:hypothetical protein
MNVSYEDMKCVIRISVIFITNGIYRKCVLSELGKIHFPKLLGGVGGYGRERKDNNELSVPKFAQHTDTSSAQHKWPNSGKLFY